MAEMSMVEKVARAIYIEWSRDAGKEESWEELVQHGHSFVDLARREARAAIEAMKDPTIEMMKQARAHHEGEHYLPHSLFNSMIDAALNEEVAG